MDNKIFAIIFVIVIAIVGMGVYGFVTSVDSVDDHIDTYVPENTTGDQISHAEAISKANEVVPNYATARDGSLDGNVWIIPVFHNDYDYQIGTIGVDASNGKILWRGI